MSSDNSNHLRVGFQLGDFSIVNVAGEGGFSIVYVAEDSFLERKVAIKEYLPTSVAARGRDSVTVLPRSVNATEGFQVGLRSFIREAKLLAQFSHPAIVDVYQVWEQNGTAYIAMRYLNGETLSDHVRNNVVFSEDELRVVLEPIFGALELLHSANIIHRDVSPDNIILADGKPVLLDLGAARVVVGGLTQALTSVLKPGYAPIEQYTDDGSMKQGPWTDVYAMSGVLYKLATGITPVQAIGRVVGDPLRPLLKIGGNFSEAFAESVMAGLTVFPEHRIKSISELRERLGWHPVSTQVVTTTVRAVKTPQGTEIVIHTPLSESVDPVAAPRDQTPLRTPNAVDDGELSVMVPGARVLHPLTEEHSPAGGLDAAEPTTSRQDDDRTVITQMPLTKAKFSELTGAYGLPTESTPPYDSAPARAALTNHYDPGYGNELRTTSALATGTAAPVASAVVAPTAYAPREPTQKVSPQRAASGEPLDGGVMSPRWWYAASSLLVVSALLIGYRVWFSPSTSGAPQGVTMPSVAPSPVSQTNSSVLIAASPTLPQPAATAPPLPQPSPLKPSEPVPTKSTGAPAPVPTQSKSSPEANRAIAQANTAKASPAPPVATASLEPRRTAPSFNGVWLGELDCQASTGPDSNDAKAFRRRVTGIVSSGELVITREGSVREEFSGAVRPDGRISLTGTGYKVADPTYRWKAAGNLRAHASREPLRMDGSIKLEKADAWAAVCSVQLTKE